MMRAHPHGGKNFGAAKAKYKAKKNRKKYFRIYNYHSNCRNPSLN